MDDPYYDLSLLDIAAIPDVGDKLAECEFFFALASQESGRERFRWLTSAFLNAAYSFFETSALHAYVAMNDEEGNPVPDLEAIAILEKYVRVRQRSNDKYYVTTSAAEHPVTQRLYKFRNQSTHHIPLSIMTAGPSLPNDFHFGSKKGQGTAALDFCLRAMELMRTVQRELDEC